MRNTAPIMKVISKHSTLLWLFVACVAVSRQFDKNDDRHLIVNGRDAQVGEFPYFVDWAGPRCGGTLIHEDIVLSAGHCHAGNSRRNVIVGVYNKNDATVGGTGDGAYPRTVVRRSLHPNFTSFPIDNDWLIMKLNESIPEIPPVRLPQESEGRRPIGGEPLTTIGLGSGSGNIVKALDIYAISDQDCAEIFSDFAHLIDPEVKFCAGGFDPLNGVGTPCSGDSGSPVLDATGTQVGLTSGGLSCNPPFLPGFYARISSAVAWIRAQICLLSSNPPAECPPIDEGLIEVSIEFTHNTSPHLTAWSIADMSGNVMVNWEQRSFWQSGLVVDTVHLIPGGDFRFQVTHSSSNGYGSFRIVVPQSCGEEGLVLATSEGLDNREAFVNFTIPEMDQMENSSCELMTFSSDAPSGAPSDPPMPSLTPSDQPSESPPLAPSETTGEPSSLHSIVERPLRTKRKRNMGRGGSAGSALRG